MNGKKEKLNVGLYDHYTTKALNQCQFFANEDGDPLHTAFDKRAVVHPGRGGQPIAPREIPKIWEQIISTTDEKGRRAAYFHIPFCLSHCLYCGFYSYEAKEREIDRYIDYLIKELVMVGDSPFINSHPFHAIYIGGGTPTDLTSANLLRLLEAIQDNLPLANDCEITVEGRLKGFSEDKIFACLEGGVNRFSLGVQSFNNLVRRKMGRILSREEVINRLEYLRDLDQTVVSIDLIYGLPYQTMEIWENDVKTFLEIQLEGVDLYQLIIFENSPLGKAIKEKRIVAADIAMQADMFARGVEIMEDARYRRLSKSHWARTTRERNMYNTMEHLPGATCVPFGCGSGGGLKGYSFFQERDLERYYQKIDNGHKPIAMCLKQPVYSDLFREIVEQMELGYCKLRELGKRHGFNLEEIFAPILEQWERVGLIKIKDGCLELTLAGEFWVENLSQNLIDYFTLTIKNKINTK